MKRSPLRLALSSLALGLLTAATATADAAEPSCAGRAGWAALRLDPGLPRTVDVGRLETLLRGRLAPAGLGLCSGAAAGNAHPTMVLHLTAAARGSVVIDVSDGTGARPATRGAVDLQTLPADGHTLAVATITDELVRAARAEQRRAIPTPPAEHAGADLTAAATGRPAPALALGVAGAQFSGGLGQIGPDLQASAGVWSRLEARARVGYRWAGSTAAPHGEVRPQAALVGLGAREHLLRFGPRLRLAFDQRIDLARVRFSATASPGNVANSTSLTALVLSAGPAFSVRLGARLSWVVQVAACFALVGARARDQASSVVALDGFGAEISSGVAMEM